ncbi:MAG: hypothetical protein MAG794_00198 [Gammaproteobacteria bacterium]|nr:hypothetical protein [Gammaproteobacteria bacterium]
MDAELILFAKTPVAGRVKTRLIPELGEQGAADFAEALIEESVRCATETWPGSVRLLAWPDPHHECFERIERRYGLTVSVQSEGNLGAKMFQALNDAYGRGVAGAIMGCDVPHCPPETYRTAHAFLTQGRAVIGPSADGGYYLVGINPPHPACFDRMDWGGKNVFDATLERAANAHIDLIVLQQLNDLDTLSDIEALRTTHPDLVGRLMNFA